MEQTHRSVAAVPRRGDLRAPPTPTEREHMLVLREMCELLWPPPAVVKVDGGHPAKRSHARAARSPGPQPTRSERREFVLIPGGRRRPPMLVPAAPRAAAAAVRHYKRPSSLGARIGSRAISLSLACGVGGSVFRRRVRVDAPHGADTIEAYLQEVIAPELWVSMHLGPPRANRKPVLELLTATGQPAGFAKIGINDLTRDLIRGEHASLEKLGQARLGEVIVPEVVHYGEWRGLDVLVLSSLPVWQSNHRVRPGRLAAAMGEVARVCGLEQHSLAAGPYLTQLRGRLATADDNQPRLALLQALTVLEERAGAETLTFGAWHGDWTPWNMASTDDGLLVWDWERFACGVPLGFDALHYWLQSEVTLEHHDPLSAATACPGHASQLLVPFQVGARQARLIASLYLVELATRYLVDKQAKAGARRGEPGTWLIPAIESEIAQL